MTTGLSRRGWGLVVALLVVAAVVGVRQVAGSSTTQWQADTPQGPAGAAPAEPAGCVGVQASDDLQEAIDSAAAGAHLCLRPGRFEGTFEIDRPLTIMGPAEAVVANAGGGSTFLITGDDVRLAGFTIVGSGGRYRDQDAGIFVHDAQGVRLEGLSLREVLFGVTSQKVDDLTLVDSDIVCRAQRALGMRGDGVRLWETRRSLVAGNRLRKCRDLVVWYSPDNLFENNRVEDGRYGTHFMYSSRNVVRGNAYVGNVVGVFVMYSRNLRIDSNVLADSGGAAGVGLGLKESGNLEVTRNLFINDATGVYVDSSPQHSDDFNLVAYNQFRLNDVAVTFHASPRQSTLVANTFRDNTRQVAVEGRGDAAAVSWRYNYFDVYAGYDLDKDGVGDIPFELRSAVEQLIGRYPAVKLLSHTPALFLVEAASRVAPLYQPRLVLRDDHPLMQPAGRSEAAPGFEQVLAEHGVVTIVEDDGRVRVRARSAGADEPTPDY